MSNSRTCKNCASDEEMKSLAKGRLVRMEFLIGDILSNKLIKNVSRDAGLENY